jgi:hypothetical protein
MEKTHDEDKEFDRISFFMRKAFDEVTYTLSQMPTICRVKLL